MPATGGARYADSRPARSPQGQEVRRFRGFGVSPRIPCCVSAQRRGVLRRAAAVRRTRAPAGKAAAAAAAARQVRMRGSGQVPAAHRVPCMYSIGVVRRPGCSGYRHYLGVRDHRVQYNSLGKLGSWPGLHASSSYPTLFSARPAGDGGTRMSLSGKPDVPRATRPAALGPSLLKSGMSKAVRPCAVE